MDNLEKIEHNKKFILRYAMINNEHVTIEDLREFSDSEEYIKTVMMYRQGFPDYTIYIEDMTAEGDFVIAQGIFRGTHKAEIFGLPPTFRKLELQMLVKYQIINDKIVNVWPMYDQMSFYEQLGAINRPK